MNPVRSGRQWPQVGFLSTFFGMFDDVMGPDFARRQREAADSNRALVENELSVVDLGILGSAEDSERLAQRLADLQLDVLVIAPTMVTPPRWLEIAMVAVRCPVIIWSATRLSVLPSGLDHLQATVHTSLVGATMLANVFVRRGTPFIVVDASPEGGEDMRRLIRTVRAAAAAHRLRNIAALRIGQPIPGYSDVETSPAELAQLGIREIVVEADDFAARVNAISASEIDQFLSHLRARRRWTMCSSPEAADSARVALALRAIASEHRVSLGTVNCHGACFRDHPSVGIVACLGVSLMHEAGIPFSCTGDLPAAIAALLANMLSGRSLYCELYVRESESGAFLVAAGGEGDPAWAEEGAVSVVPNTYYPGKRGHGLSVSFPLQSGPATLLSTTPTAHGWRLIWATGEIGGRTFPELHGPNGMFRFHTTPPQTAAERWMTAGPTHHPALAAGHLDLELPVVASLCGLQSHRI